MKISYANIFEYPVNITWEIIGKCNYQCIHCRMDDENNQKDMLSLEKIKGIIDQLCQIQITNIIYTGGEPFLRNDFLEILEYTNRKGIGFSINTNGSLISEEIVNKLVSYEQLRLVQISLDGKDKETHDFIRNKPGAYDKAIAAIKLLKNRGVRVGVDTTVMKINHHQIRDIFMMLKDIGVDVFGARRFMPIGHGNLNTESLILTPEEYKEHCATWCNLVKEYGTVMQMFIEEPLMAIFQNDLPEDWQLGGCIAGSVSASIMADGTVQPCVITPIKLGNLNDDTFQEIWKKSKNIREMFYNKKLLIGKCQDCKLKEICGGCRGVAKAMKGNYIESDPFCFY